MISRLMKVFTRQKKLRQVSQIKTSQGGIGKPLLDWCFEAMILGVTGRVLDKLRSKQDLKNN